MPLPPRVAARRPGIAAAAPLRVPLSFQKRGGEPRRSRYRVTLPGASLPIEALEVVPEADHVLRTAAVTELRLTGSTLTPHTLGAATLRRSVKDGVAADALAIPI